MGDYDAGFTAARNLKTMATPSAKQHQDDQVPFLGSWRSMSQTTPIAPRYGSDLPTTDKKEFELSGSASNSDIEVHKTGFRGKDTGQVTFATTGLGNDHYRPVDTYEGIHRYDPDFGWESEEETKVVRKVRAYICL